MDTLVAALLVSERRDPSPVRRLEIAVQRIEQLLGGLGFIETAKTLREFREACSEVAPPIETQEKVSVVAEPGDDPLIGRARKRKVVAPNA
jgi:hypothetical protein